MSKKTNWKKIKKENPEIKKAFAAVDKHKQEQREARNYGRRVGGNIYDKYNDLTEYEDYKGDKQVVGFGTDIASTAIAEMLYQISKKDRGREGCFNLLMQWTQEKLWAKIVMEKIPQLQEIWEFLYNNGYTNEKDGHSYGDADGRIWAEFIKGEEKFGEYEDKKIIIYTSYCCRAIY